MKLFVENQDLEREIEAILGLIRLRMNGVAVDQMEERGVKYRVNYGVGFPHLKELATRFRRTYDLTERLWFMEIRETMLLAAMLVPKEEMTLERCMEWSKQVNNIDLVERSSMILWGQLPIAGQLVEEWKQSGNYWMEILANYTLGWMLQKQGKCEAVQIDRMLDEQMPDDYLYFKSLSFVIRKMLRLQGKSTPKLKLWVDSVLASGKDKLKVVAQEILSEIQFVEEN